MHFRGAGLYTLCYTLYIREAQVLDAVEEEMKADRVNIAQGSQPLYAHRAAAVIKYKV